MAKFKKSQAKGCFCHTECAMDIVVKALICNLLKHTESLSYRSWKYEADVDIIEYWTMCYLKNRYDIFYSSNNNIHMQYCNLSPKLNSPYILKVNYGNCIEVVLEVTEYF